jgi:hypothetical protein
MKGLVEDREEGIREMMEIALTHTVRRSAPSSATEGIVMAVNALTAAVLLVAKVLGDDRTLHECVD